MVAVVAFSGGDMVVNVEGQEVILNVSQYCTQEHIRHAACNKHYKRHGEFSRHPAATEGTKVCPLGMWG